MKAKDRLKNHKPNPGWQVEFDKSLAQGRLACCGNQGGKTHLGSIETGRYALNEHPHKQIRTPNTGVIVSAQSQQEGIVKNILPKLKKAVGSEDIRQIKNDQHGKPASIIWRSGSITYLMSAEQDNEAFEGITLDYFWIDEPVRRAIYVALSRGLMESDGHWWWTATLLDEPWIYEEIYLVGKGEAPKKDDTQSIEVFEGTTDENIHLSDAGKEKFFATLTEDELQTRRYGKPAAMQGRVFKSYDPEKNRIPAFDIPSHWPVWISIDPHPNKPHAVMFMAISPTNDFYVCNEIFIKCTIHELAGHIVELKEQYYVVQILIDTSSQQDDWSKQSAREMLAEAPYFIRTKLAQKKNLKKSGLSLMNQFFKNAHDPGSEGQKLFVFETCLRTHRELLYQKYKVNKREPQMIYDEVEKKWDDMSDNCRYILVEKPKFRGTAKIIDHGPLYGRGGE